MSLFHFEFKKLLLNKKTVSLLACLFILYSLMGFVTSMFLIGNRESSLHGWNAAIQSIPTYARSMFGFRTWQLAVVGAVWLIFTGAVYSLIIGFISSRMKSQMGTVGVSLAVLFINVGLAAMGDAVTQRFKPLCDFGLANVTLIKEVFGGFKMFDVFGMCVSYPVMVVFVLGLTAALTGFGIYRGQKSRTVA